MCERMGNAAISLTGRGTEMKVDTPFHVQTDFCIGCGACASVCPTGHIKLEDIAKHAVKPIPSEYDMGLKGRKPIYVPYAQAIPNTPVIDRSRCVHFKTGGCKICAEFCGVGAIDHSQQDEIVELDVGADYPGAGLRPLRPLPVRNLPLRQALPNVVTSMEFERILCASGPYQGPPGAALRPQGAQEDRLAPVRRLPGLQPLRPRLLLLGLLHVRHQGGGDRQGARGDGPGLRRLLHGHAHPRQGLRALLRRRQGEARRPLHPLPGAHRRAGAGHRRPADPAT